MKTWFKFLQETFPGRSLDEIQEMLVWALAGLFRLDQKFTASISDNNGAL